MDTCRAICLIFKSKSISSSTLTSSSLYVSFRCYCTSSFTTSLVGDSVAISFYGEPFILFSVGRGFVGIGFLPCVQPIRNYYTLNYYNKLISNHLHSSSSTSILNTSDLQGFTSFPHMKVQCPAL